MAKKSLQETYSRVMEKTPAQAYRATQDSQGVNTNDSAVRMYQAVMGAPETYRAYGNRGQSQGNSAYQKYQSIMNGAGGNRTQKITDWTNRYNKLAKGLETGYTQELVDEADSLAKAYNGASGVAYAARRDERDALEKIYKSLLEIGTDGKKQLARDRTASGLLPEDASALAGQKQKYERMLFELQKQMKENRGAESVQAEIEGLERSKATEDREKEIRSLKGTLGDINSQLNIYNRIDKFGDDVTAKYAGGNSTEARDAWRTGKDGREQTFREKEQALRKDSTPYAARESGASGNAYAAALSNPQSADFTERLNDYKSEKNRQIIDRLDEYLTWFDGLSEESQRRIRSSDVNGQNPYRDSEITQNDPGNQNKHWGQMTEDERNAVFQIANTEGADAAAKYLDDLQMTLDRRQTLAMEQNEKDRAEKTPLIGDMLRGAATVGANLVGAPISFIGNARDAINGKGFNPYSNANFLLNQSGSVREASSQEVYRAIAGDGSNKKLDFLGTLASNAYQAGLSTLDSLAGMATMGKFYTISMGMGAASQRMRELVESGASDREIYVGAIGSGILEALFEKVSLDTFADQWIKANPEKFIRKALIQAGVEGSEEVFTEISNQILDAVNRGVNSDHRVRVRALMKENPGMSETEAEQQAASEDAQEVFWAGFGGALSGGLSSFGGLAIEGHKARQGGTEILSRGQAGEVLQNALELRPNDKAAQNLQSKMNDNTLGKKGRDLSGLYRVAQQNAADMTRADVEAVRTGLEKRLTDMGVPNNGKATAEAIIKQLTGKKLSMTDRLALAKNRDAVATVRNEIVSAAAYPTAANKWVRDIKTFQIGRLGHGAQMFGTAETQTQKSARETMEKALNQVMGSNSAIVSAMYDEGQSRSDFTTEAAEIYRAGQDGRGLDGVSLGTIGAEDAMKIYNMGVRSAEGVGTYDYIEDGQAYRKSDSTPVNVTGFAGMGANPTLSIGNGETVKASDITFGSFGESRLYNTIAKMGVDTQTANDMLKAAENANINASTYSVALNNAYMQGLSGIAFGNIRENSEAMRLDADTRKAAWSAGRAQAERNDRAKQSVTDKGKHGRKVGGLTVEDSAKNVKLNRQQEAGMNAARVLAGMGLNVSVFASTEAERKDDIYNGIFRSADGSIRVDLNAGKDGQGVMGYALSHEFTHFVEELSAEKFRKFTDILFDVLGKSDVDVNRLIEAKEAVLRNTEEYKNRSDKELRAIAYSEVVAEMMEPVLTDTDAISRISQKIKQQDRGLWGKIKDFIKGIVEKLKAAYRDMEPDSAIARLTRQTVTNSEAVLDAFSEAAADAVLNYNLQDGQKNNAREGGLYSLREQTQQELTTQYQADVDSILNMQDTTQRQLLVGYTPSIYQELGMPSLPLTIGSGHVYSTAKTEAQARQDGNYKRGVHYHGLGDAAVKNIYNAIQDPVMIIAAKDVNKNASPMRSTHSVVAIVDIGTAGKSLLVPIEITAERTVNGVQMDVNTISSVYERNVSNLVKEAIALENSGDVGVYYAKKEALTLPAAGVRFPVRLQQSIASNSIIHRFSEKVNMKISENTQSQQFKRWFGDWQNDPASASKIVNEDGTPKVMYHGTNAEFTVFDRSKGKKKIHLNVLGDGNYFTASEQGAARYGENVIPVYLNIKNPYVKADGFNTVADQIASEFGIARDSFTGKDVSSILRQRGYDGVVMYDGNGEIVIANAFDSTQIKSATDNIGTFDGSNPDILYSSRTASDSEYLNLAQNPEENREALSRMVEQAAKEAGYTEVVYHGTNADFTVFDKKTIGKNFGAVSDLGFYFTPYYEDARGYSTDWGKQGARVMKGVLKFQNPLVIEDTGWGSAIEQTDNRHGDLLRWAREGKHDGIIVRSMDEEFLDDNGNHDTVYIAFDSNQFKSLDPVTYDDNGNVIPLSQRFNMGKEDIRYSARNPQAQVEAENERLKTELEYLKKLVQIQKRGNKDFTLDRNSLREAARTLMNANNVKGNVAELAEILDRVYRYAGTEPEITWESFAEKAGEAADWLTENRVKERDPYAQQVLDAVAKRRVSLNAEQIGEIEYRYGSLSEFKKAIRGSIILDQNANTSLDQLWQELSGEYPGTFDAGTTDADMPGAFADIVDELRNSESANEAERQYYADEERNQLIRQVYDGYWDVDPVQSVSDKAKKEIDQLKAEHREAIRELKAENRQLKSNAQSQVAAAVREYRQQNNAMTREMKKTYERQLKEVQKGYEKFRSQAESLSSESTLRYQNEFYNALMGTENLGKAKVPELRKKFRELAVENSGKDMDARKARQAEYTRLLDEFLTSRDIGKLRTTIQEQRDRAKAKVEAARVTEERGKLYRAVNEVNRRLLNPTKTLYVPDSLAPAVTKFMQGLTEAMESPKNSWNVQGALETLQGQYQKLTQMNEGVFTQEYNQGILDLLDNAINAVGGTDFNKLSESQIEDVYSAVRSVLTAIRNENKMFAANLNKTYAEAAEAVRREESALPNRKPTTGSVQDKAEKFGWNQLKPVYAMMRLGSDTLLKQYNNLRAGEDKWERTIAAARAYGLGIMAKYNYDQWNDNLMKLDTETGTVELSLEERMSLYAYARREQAFEHLTKGGFVLSDKNTRTVKNRFGIETEQKVQDYNAYVLTADQVAGIRGAENILQLTEEQRQFADAMQDYLSTVCAELNNEISRALYGVSIAKEKYYWPIKSSGVFSEMIRNQMQNPSNRQKNAGHMKATVRGANNAIELMGFMETWATHVNNTAMYNAFTLPMEDFMRVWNWRDTSGLGNRSMRQLILQKHGQAGVDYIDTFIKDLNKGVRGDPRESLLNSMLGKFKKGAVSASLSVAIQQPSAVGRALKYIDPKYFLGARVEGVDGINATWEVMQQYAPVVGIKDIGRFDMDMGRSTIDILSGKNETGVMATIDKLSGFLPEYMDKVTWVAMWEACKRQVKAQNPSLRGEALLTKAGALFTKTVTETQVYDSVFSRSGLMRSPSVAAKAVTAFMAEPTTTANMVYQAIQDFRHGDRTGAARTLASVGTAIVLNSLLASLVYASRDDDEEKTWLEKYLKSFTAEMIDGVNPLGYIPVVKDIFSIFQGYDVIRSDMSQWADLAKTLQKFTKAWKSYGEADEDDREARKEALKNAGIASTNLLASILNLGGIPLRNLLREIQGGVNIVKDIQRGLPSDSRTKGYAIWEALNAYMPQIMRSDDGKSKQVYKAVISGSAAWVNRLKSTYKNEDTFNRAVVTALVNNDSRIREAARAAVSGNSAERDRLAKEIVKEGHFTEKQVEDAIEKRIEQLPGASYDDMLDALRNGGDVKAAQANLAKYGYTQTQMENKVKSAAKEWYQGGVISAIDARKMLRDYGGMLTRDAQATVQKWTALLSTGTDFDEIQDEYLTGNLSRSRAVEMYVKFGGATQADAEATVKKWDCEKELGVKYDDLKDAYLGGDISADRVLSAMMKYGGVKEDSARATVEAYKWIRQHPKTELDVGQVKTYTKAIDTLGYSVEDAGISESVYLTFLEKASACTGEDKNGDGRTDSGSVRNQVVQVIDALPISGTQKDALYFAKGYAKRDLHKAPWH